MARKATTKATPASVRRLAARYPGVAEGSACVNAAFKAGKKSFLFLGEREDRWDARVKLTDSVPEAEALAAAKPQLCEVGKHGWVILRLARGESPPAGVLERWIDESYRALAPKKLVAALDGPPA